MGAETIEILWWHWVILGIILMLTELVLASFTILWFGMAAVVIGLLLLVIPMSLTIQILLWTILSVLTAWGWFKYIKPMSIDKTKAGLSRESIVNEVGNVLTIPHSDRRGKLRFPAPVLGSDEWEIISEDTLEVGDRVRVVDLSGNTLIVTKHSG